MIYFHLARSHTIFKFQFVQIALEMHEAILFAKLTIEMRSIWN